MRSIRSLILALVLAPAALQAQSANLDSTLVASIAATFAAHLDSIPTRMAGRREPLPIRIIDSGYTAAERAILEAAILRAARTRPVTPADSERNPITVDRPRFHGDTASVQIDDGWLACENGSEFAGGTVYEYEFERRSGGWYFLRSNPEIIYDPAPPPPPGAPPRGCPSFDRPRGGTTPDAALRS